MKRKSLASAICLCAISIGLLSSCGSMVVGKCYSLDQGTHYGDYIARISVSLNKGTIAEAKIDETYSPCVWARVNPNEKTDANIETIEVDDAYGYEGNTAIIYFAKHIQISDMTFTGTLRNVNDDDTNQAALYGRGEYIKYKYDGVTSETDTLNDLYTYLAVADTDVYKLGSRYQWYFDAVTKGNIKVLGYKSSATLLDVTDYSLGFPSNKVLRSESDVSATWKTSIEALCTWMTNKKINYVYKTADADGNQYKCLKTVNGVWNYNAGYTEGVFSNDNWDPITGCLSSSIGLNSIKVLFDGINRAFASVEYASMK